MGMALCNSAQYVSGPCTLLESRQGDTESERLLLPWKIGCALTCDGVVHGCTGPPWVLDLSSHQMETALCMAAQYPSGC